MTKSGFALSDVDEASAPEAVHAAYPAFVRHIVRRDTEALTAPHDHVRVLRPKVAGGTPLRQALDEMLGFLEAAFAEIETVAKEELLRLEVTTWPHWLPILRALEAAPEGLKEGDLAARSAAPAARVREALNDFLARELVEFWAPDRATERTWMLAPAGKKVLATLGSSSE